MALTSKLFKGIAAPAALQPNVVVVTGRVAIGASGAVGAQTGKGFSVAKSNTGLYTITFTASSGVPDILSAFVELANDSGTVQHFAAVRALDAGDGTVTVHTAAVDAPETAANPAEGAVLQFVAYVQNSGVTG